MKTEKQGFSAKEVEEIYGASEGHLANMRCRLEGPKFYRVGRKILYFREDLEAYFRQQPVLTSVSQPETIRRD
jgi:hypothetical protein